MHVYALCPSEHSEMSEESGAAMAPIASPLRPCSSPGFRSSGARSSYKPCHPIPRARRLVRSRSRGSALRRSAAAAAEPRPGALAGAV